MSKKFTLIALAGAFACGLYAYQNANQPDFNGAEVKATSDPIINAYYNPDRAEMYANAPVRKSESADSAALTINATYSSTADKVSHLILMPKFNVNVAGYVSNTKADTYNMTVAKGIYQLVIVGEKPNYVGQFVYFRDDINITSDSTISFDINDCNIVTSHKLYLPDGEEVAPDTYCTKTKEVTDTGNVRQNSGVYMSLDFDDRYYSHINHICFTLFKQYYADPNIITDTWRNPTLFTNTKKMPIHFTYDYCINGNDGKYGIRFDVNDSNFGDTLTTKSAPWHSITLKQKEIICDTVPADYDPSRLNGNGTGLHWIDGLMINSGTGASIALPSDTRNRYHMNCAVINGTDKGADFAVFTGLPVTKLGTAYHGFNALPITLGKNGIEFLPIQYLYPGMKVWAGSDGSDFYIYDNKNPRLNADAETLWGEGFPFATFYPAVKVTAAISPRFDITIKGNNGEQRASDVVGSTFSAYKYIDSTSNWNQIWTGTFDKITQIQTNIKNNGAGLYAAEVVDTAYMLNGKRGRSVSRVELNNFTADPNPPSINMLNVRNANDRIETFLNTNKGATVELYAADMTYNFVKIYGYTLNSVKDVIVECAPAGTDNFQSLPVTVHPERELPLFWGQNYSADLSKLNKKSNDGWYDLRVTVSDPAGNKAMVYAQPAFHIDAIDAVETVSADNQVDIIVEGGMISVPGMPEAEIDVYDMNGCKLISGHGTVDASILQPGIYMIKVNHEANTAVKKVYIK